MSHDVLEFGDRVRHPRRPEWGVGAVVKVEAGAGPADRSVTVRFPNAGLKTLHTRHVTLERVTEIDDVPEEPAESAVATWDRVDANGWLGPMAQRKIDEAMVALPTEATDPFLSLRERLEFTLRLYRFDRSGRGLVDWAVAQTGLDDPLTRFNRHELEQHFDRWATGRDELLGRLLTESQSHKSLIQEIVGEAPRSAQQAVRRLTVAR